MNIKDLEAMVDWDTILQSVGRLDPHPNILTHSLCKTGVNGVLKCSVCSTKIYVSIVKGNHRWMQQLPHDIPTGIRLKTITHDGNGFKVRFLSCDEVKNQVTMLRALG